MRRAVLLAALLLTACSDRASPLMTDLPSPGYISGPRSYPGGLSVDGYATYRTRIGGRSAIQLGISWSQPVLDIEFVSKDNWLDHHTDVQFGWGSGNCQVDSRQKRIVCRRAQGTGPGDVQLYGTAVEAGTFHYAIKLSDQADGPPHWVTEDSGRELIRKWDELVTR
jgi:hypothetical protein